MNYRDYVIGVMWVSLWLTLVTYLILTTPEAS